MVRKKVRVKKTYLYPFIIFLLLLIVVVFYLAFFQKHDQILGCAGFVDDEILSKNQSVIASYGEFEGRIVTMPPFLQTEPLAQILGESTDANKRIEVDLANQRVYAYEGNAKVFDFIVSTGKWYPTPTGTFTIERKVRSQVMSGGNRAINTYYYLPNVPWVMYFGNSQIPWNRGFSFHGAYWHNNFGQPMSHGCVNMQIPDSKNLYTWASIGTKVSIY